MIKHQLRLLTVIRIETLGVTSNNSITQALPSVIQCLRVLSYTQFLEPQARQYFTHPWPVNLVVPHHIIFLFI